MHFERVCKAGYERLARYWFAEAGYWLDRALPTQGKINRYHNQEGNLTRMYAEMF